MAIKIPPEIERPETLPTKTLPRRSGGWFRRLQQRIKLALAGDDEELMVENKTTVQWLVYHNYHRLGIIDAGELLVLHVYKHGSLSVRPWKESDEVEYLVIPLNFDVNHVYIYRRHMSEDVEVYDMRIV